jgi:hypothetical protein
MNFQDNKERLLDFVLNIQKLYNDIKTQSEERLRNEIHSGSRQDVFLVLYDKIKTENEYDCLDHLRKPFVSLLICHLTKEDSDIRAKIYDILDYLTKELNQNVEINVWRCRETINSIVDGCSSGYLNRFIYKDSKNDCIADIVSALETFEINGIQSFVMRLEKLANFFLNNGGTVDDDVERGSLDSIALYILDVVGHLKDDEKLKLMSSRVTDNSQHWSLLGYDFKSPLWDIVPVPAFTEFSSYGDNVVDLFDDFKLWMENMPINIDINLFNTFKMNDDCDSLENWPTEFLDHLKEEFGDFENATTLTIRDWRSIEYRSKITMCVIKMPFDSSMIKWKKKKKKRWSKLQRKSKTSIEHSNKRTACPT